jgi:hypothetical protein
MPSCLLLESIIQDPVYKGDNHHEDHMILLTLTSSRIDSIRTLQHLVDYKIVLLIIQIKGHVRDQRPSNKVLQFADIPSGRTFGTTDNIETDLITLCQ